MSLTTLATQVLNGVSFGGLLFLVSSGFTLIFGLLRVVNLAHGALYLVGAYVGIATYTATSSFVLGAAAAAGSVALLGIGLERTVLRRVRGRELSEVLLTVGVSLVLADLCLALFGGDPKQVDVPSALAGSVTLGGFAYPRYRLFVAALAIALAVVLYVLTQRTKLGATIRAGVDDREIANALGVDISRVFTGVFAFGAALAGLAGFIGGGMLAILPGADVDILLLALVVVIVGGLGSVKGAAIGSLLIGLIDAFSKAWIPDLAYFTVFAPMALLLLLRPSGLFGKAA
ncbi:MAG: branched-chain amino acid ABC transporter permease [Nocardioidaceae bacterium]|nr:branched-chain amino acid ABC transporter permease [Nocardioidaceae bacterium]